MQRGLCCMSDQIPNTNLGQTEETLIPPCETDERSEVPCDPYCEWRALYNGHNGVKQRIKLHEIEKRSKVPWRPNLALVFLNNVRDKLIQEQTLNHSHIPICKDMYFFELVDFLLWVLRPR